MPPGSGYEISFLVLKCKILDFDGINIMSLTLKTLRRYEFISKNS